jgi:hypothetical protein
MVFLENFCREANMHFSTWLKLSSGLLLLLDLTSAEPAAAVPTHLSISGAAFICADQAATGNCPNAEFDTASGTMQNAQGTWAANVSLPQGAVVSGLLLCGNFNEVGSSITATLDKTPLRAASGFPTPTAMATVSSSGASNQTQCFKTSTITSPTINNAENQYYVVVVVPDNNGVIFTSVQILY